jgi:chromosome segregation ATPase
VCVPNTPPRASCVPSFQIIKRCLHAKSETSKWFLDGKPSNQKAVLAVVERTGAQIANLCTFLPQEKVGEFSGFDAVQLLQETEKAVGGPDLFDDHRKLVAAESEIGDVERQLESKTARVEELKDQNKVLERDREKMEEREGFLLKAALCKQR